MEYKELASELMRNMFKLSKARPQRLINESMKGESFMIHYINLHGGAVLPSEISNTMGISSARIAAALNSLERKGLITRQIDISDRRRILVNLTPEGKEFAGKHNQEGLEALAKIIGLLGEKDALEYVRITGKLAELASKYKELK